VPKYVNDGSNRSPRLRVDLNAGNLYTLPPGVGPQGDLHAKFAAVKAAGFEGVQFSPFQPAEPALCRELNLRFTESGRIDKVGEIDAHAARWADAGADCATLHVGTGMEDDATALAMIEDIERASTRRVIPLYIETHRATITQDIWRTVQFAQRFPTVRFNGDFSHWYTGLEMVYGDLQAKFAFLAPVFERTAFIHGRIGDPGCIQRDIGDGTGLASVDHFRDMWVRAFNGFLTHAGPGDIIVFTPELLQPEIFYARTLPGPDGKPVEEGNRWQQALVYKRIAEQCWSEAERLLRA
jgi:hypothetical protein